MSELCGLKTTYDPESLNALPPDMSDGDVPVAQSGLEKVEEMLQNLNLFNLLRDGGEITGNTARTVTRNELWKVINVAYTALKAGVCGHSQPAATCSIDERLDSMKREILETMNNSMKSFAESLSSTVAAAKPANSTPSFADVLKAKPATTAKLTLSGNSDEIQSTTDLLNKTPTTFRKTNTDGSVVLGFKSAAELTRATQKINSANTGVKVEEFVSKPLITVRNAEVSFIPQSVVEKAKTDELIKESIRVLNGDIAEALDEGETMEVIFFQRHRQRPDLATVGLRVTRPLSELLLNKGHIHVGHFLCPVEKRYAIKQCFKCQSFGHVLKDCKADSPKCFRCAGDHFGRDCVKRTREFRKCSNCAESSNQLFKSGAMSHNAASIDCPVLLQHVNSKN